MPSLRLIQESAAEIVSLLDEYPYWPGDERQVDRIVYAYLQGRFGNASRQWPVVFTGGTHGRIDFRTGGTNPAVIELVVRTSQGGNLSVSGNRDELEKLSRIPSTEARARILLLMDLREDPVDFERLKRGYSNYYLGRGRFVRESVSIAYVSRGTQEHFSWTPFR